MAINETSKSSEGIKPEKFTFFIDEAGTQKEEENKILSELRDQRNEIDSLVRKNRKIERLINKQNKELSNTRDELNETRDDSKHIKLDFIQTLGIFVALFTFVSIEFRFLNQPLCFTQLLALNALLLGSLILFVILLGFLTNINKVNLFYLLILILAIIALGLAIYPTWENKNINCRILNNIENNHIKGVK